MKHIRALAFALGLLPAIAAAQVPNWPQTLPANTVVGRLGIGPGPSQPIPISVLFSKAKSITTPATGFHYAPDANIQRFSDRVFIGGATENLGTNVASQPDWLTTWQLAHGASFGYIQTSASAVLNGADAASLQAITAGAQTLNATPGGNAIGFASFGVNNKPAGSITAYGFYGEGHRCGTCVGGAYGAELNTVNFNPSVVTIDPYIQSIGQTLGLQIAAGGDVYNGQYSSTAAINLRDNNAKFRSGIIFGSSSLDTTGNPQPDALALADNQSITWYNGTASKQWKVYSNSSNLNIATNNTGSVVAAAPLYASSLNTNVSTGNGFFQAGDQSADPATPSSALRIFSDASNRLSWKGANGFSARFDAASNSASRIYTLPDVAGTVLLANSTATLTNKTFDTAGSGNVLRINGTGITAVTGTGSAALSSGPTFTGTVTASVVNMSGNSSVSNNQNNPTSFTINNNDAGSNARALYNLVTNAGSFTVAATSTAGSASALFQWSGSGDMFFDHINATGGMQFRTGATPTTALTIDNAQAATFSAGISAATTVKTGSTTVGSLPACNAGLRGARHFVTDANSTTFASTAAGGGSNNVPVVCNGSNWIIG